MPSSVSVRRLGNEEAVRKFSVAESSFTLDDEAAHGDADVGIWNQRSTIGLERISLSTIVNERKFGNT